MSPEASVQISIVTERGTRDDKVLAVWWNLWVNHSNSDLAAGVRWSHFLTGKSCRRPGRGCMYCRPQKCRGARVVASLRLSRDPRSDLTSPAAIPFFSRAYLALETIFSTLTCGSETSILLLSHMKPRYSTDFDGVIADFPKLTS